MPAENPAGTSGQTKEPSLADLLVKVMLAYGGREALARLAQDVTAQGRKMAFAGEEPGQAFAWRKIRKGSRLCLELEPLAGAGEPPVITVSDGTSGFTASATNVTELSAAAARDLLGQDDRQPALIVHFREPGYEFAFLGRTSYKHLPVYAVKLEGALSPPATIFIDQNNYLVVALSQEHRADGSSKATTVTREFLEYRPVAGTLAPFRQLEYRDGKLVEELTLDSIAVEAPVDAHLFRRPGQIRVSIKEPVVVPVEYSHNEILVKVRINSGEPLDFLLDTGASDTIVDRRTAAEHYLDKQGSFEIAAASQAVTMQSSMIRKLDLGGVVLEEVPALILDLTPQSRELGRPVRGIIGNNVLSKLAVTIDYARPAVTLADADSYRPPEGAAIVPFAQRPGPVVKAVLNGVDEQPFLIDTGAAFNHLSHEAAGRYVSGHSPRLTEGTGLDGRPVKLGVVVVDSVEIADQKARQVSFTYPYEKEAPAGRGGFFQTHNVGILGNPFWQNFVLTIDYKQQRLVIQPNPMMKAKSEMRQLVTTGDARLIIHRDYRSAALSYEKALASARTVRDTKQEARIVGRLGNLHRVMARDLNRPEQAKVAYGYFSQAQALARKAGDRECEGRILADWSLLYSDSGQTSEAARTIESALALAPQDPQVNVDYAVHLYRARLYGDMQRYVEKALALDPSNWQALWYQVKLAEMFQDRQRLKTTLREILRFYPFSKLAREKLTALTQPSPSGSHVKP